MRSEQVLATFRAFLDGRHDEAVSYLRQIEATETRNNNHTLATRVRRLYERQGSMQMIQLPSAPSGLLTIQPQRDLETVILSDDTRDAIRQIIQEWKHREALENHDLRARNVIMLSGPSGNGKTVLAEALAKAMSLPFAIVNYGDVIDSYLGGTAKALQNLFDFIRKTPALLFFDEADSLLMARRGGGERGAGQENNRMVNAMLMQLDRMPSMSCVVFATNMRNDLDTAIARRLSVDLTLDAPRNGERQQMLKLLVKRWPFIQDGEWVTAAESAKSFAEIESIARDAARTHVLDNFTVPLKAKVSESIFLEPTASKCATNVI